MPARVSRCRLGVPEPSPRARRLLSGPHRGGHARGLAPGPAWPRPQTPDRRDRGPARPRDRLSLADRTDRHHDLPPGAFSSTSSAPWPNSRRRSSGSAPARAWPPPAPAAGSAAARASSPPRSSPPPRRCERRSTRWPRSRPRSGSAARPSTATWRSAPSPTITPRRSSDGTPASSWQPKGSCRARRQTGVS